jgi:hypothetical protein
MNVISFCIYGNIQMYIQGITENLKLCKTIYPDWKPFVYASLTIPTDTLKTYKDLGADVYMVQDRDRGFFMNYRYLALEDTRVTRAIFRDADSRVGIREAEAVEEWIQQDTDLHIMKDHPYHTVPILGGMWGAKAEKIRDIKDIINKYFSYENDREIDQYLLRVEIYPRLCNSVTLHDEFFDKKPFPSPRKDIHFVGCQYDENNNILHPEHIDVLNQFINNK